MFKPQRLLAFILSLVTLVALAACGAPAPGNPTPTPGDGTPEPTVTPTPTPNDPNVPEWVLDLIEEFKNDEVADPPLSIAEYLYHGETVYFVPQRCCDIPSDLYDADGNLIAHPDGGITGGGDGRAPDFFEEAKLVRVIWVDDRGPEGRELIEAPIVDVRIVVDGGRYAVKVVSALPDGCHVFAGWEIDDSRFEDEKVIVVTVRNTYPVREDVACAEVYETVETIIPLPYDFVDGETYTITVNGTEVTFVAGEDPRAEAQQALDEARARWEAAGIADYTADFNWACFCIRERVHPVHITVEDGAIVSVVYAEDPSYEPEGEPNPEDYRTVEGLFDLIQEAIDQGADEIRAEYHETLGYPVEVWIDYSRMTADEELGFSLEVHVPQS